MINKSSSKPLMNSDQSGFDFAKEMLQGSPTAGINFDRVQKHPVEGYIIFEYLLCEEIQYVTPYSSHPRKYWHLNSKKFTSLWNIANDLNAKLYLVNYAKKGTKHEDEVLLIEVISLDSSGIKEEKVTKLNRVSFSKFFRKLNNECL
jgi:hypothetical protein